MKRIILALFVALVALPGFAQRFSPQEYQKRFEAFVTKEAGLTKEEAAKFFPLYHEMQDKQREYFHQIRHINYRTDPAKTSEAEFRMLNDKICELSLKKEKVELDYINKFRKIISDKKYFLVKKAEESFQFRELHHQRQNERKDKR